jgi:hypothetical protein
MSIQACLGDIPALIIPDCPRFWHEPAEQVPTPRARPLLGAVGKKVEAIGIDRQVHLHAGENVNRLKSRRSVGEVEGHCFVRWKELPQGASAPPGSVLAFRVALWGLVSRF